MKANAAPPGAAASEAPATELLPAPEAQKADLETFLPADVARAVEPPPPRPFVGVRSARLVSHHGRAAVVILRGDDEPREVPLDSEVDAQIVAEALETGERVLVEADEEGELAVVGVLRSRVPDKIVLRADTIELDAEHEVLIRSGKGAMRIREDGDIEVVGSRISAASRGLFRLVGKMLRLN
jgi:hypothetical protein